MERQTDERALSTADLADADQEQEEMYEPEDRGGSPSATHGEDATPLLDETQTQRFGAEWESIQTDFVDEPRHAVERADALVADLMQRLAATFAQERSELESQWDRGDQVSTEDLRVALQRYRSFFGRLLKA